MSFFKSAYSYAYAAYDSVTTKPSSTMKIGESCQVHDVKPIIYEEAKINENYLGSGAPCIKQGVVCPGHFEEPIDINEYVDDGESKILGRAK